MTELRATRLGLGYHGRTVITGLDLRISPGRIAAVVGPNACGKSTLLRGLARLLHPDTGTVLLDGRDIHRLPTREVAARVDVLPQQPVAPEGITTGDLVARGRHPQQTWLRQWSAADEQAVTTALAVTGVTELADRPVDDELSGGQRQRVWIALALAQHTDLLLLDEPTTFLDLAPTSSRSSTCSPTSTPPAARSSPCCTTSTWPPDTPTRSSRCATAPYSPRARPPRSSTRGWSRRCSAYGPASSPIRRPEHHSCCRSREPPGAPQDGSRQLPCRNLPLGSRRRADSATDPYVATRAGTAVLHDFAPHISASVSRAAREAAIIPGQRRFLRAFQRWSPRRSVGRRVIKAVITRSQTIGTSR